MNMPQARTAGRPSVAQQRRAQIVDAFISLLGEAPTVNVAITEVATRAGVSRTAIAHFVGDRDDLIAAATAELQDRYQQALDVALGSDPTPHDFVDVLFSDDWALVRTTDDRAFEALRIVAEVDRVAREQVRNTYQHFLDRLTTAITRHCPHVDDPAGQAWACIALAEHHASMLALGFEPDWNDRVRLIARTLFEEAR